jgi:hypothetical protein
MEVPTRCGGVRSGRAVPQPCADCHAVRGRPTHSAAARSARRHHGKRTCPWRSRRRGGVRGPVPGQAWRSRTRNSAHRCLPAARAARRRRQEAKQERCAANRAKVRPPAAPAAASLHSIEAALNSRRLRQLLRACP